MVVARAVATGGIARVVEQRVGGLVALEIDDAKHLALFDFTRPMVTGLDDAAINRPGGIEGAGGLKVHGSRFKVHGLLFGIGCWALDVRGWMFAGSRRGYPRSA